MKKLIIPLFILFTAVSCTPPTALLDKLEDDVKSANDLYLEIVSISPAENQLFTNPGQEVRIEFDRAIDMESIEDFVKILDNDGELFGAVSDKKSLEYEFDESSNILIIAANPYLDGLQQYTVEILEGLKGKDGSLLREKLSWSFTTNDDPRGYVEIVEEYTGDNDVDINVYSSGATYYALLNSSTEEVDESTSWIPIAGNPTAGTATIDISGGDGPRPVYVVFRDGFANEARTANVSRVENDTTIYDSTPPVISFNWSTLYGNIANSGNPTATASVSDTSSGLGSVAWSGDAGLTFDAANSTTCPITVTGSDGGYTIRLTAEDAVGNSTFLEGPLVRDTVIPGAPSVVENDPSITTDLSPDFTVTANDVDVSRFQYRLKDGTYTGSWTNYYGSVSSQSYGDIEFEFRSVDDAGNYSTSVSGGHSFIITPKLDLSGKISPIFPADGDSLIGDIVWYYTPGKYYRFYYKKVGTIGLFTRLGSLYRSEPYVDTSEKNWDIKSTYQWYLYRYDDLSGNGAVRIPSDTRQYFSFTTSIFRF